MEFDLFADTFSAKDKIYRYLESNGQQLDTAIADLAANAMKRGLVRQLMEEREENNNQGKLRGSNSGPCCRKMAYGYHGIPQNGKTIDARAKLTFLTGDILEVIVVVLLKLAGVKTTGTILDEGGQINLMFPVNDQVGVPGHGDGILLPQDDITVPYLLEIKSFSEYEFKNRFSKGIISDGYKLQHNVYYESLHQIEQWKNVNDGLFIGVCKNSGELAEVHTNPDPEFIEWARENYQAVLDSRPDLLPARYHDGDAYGVKVAKGEVTDELAALCGYCAWFNECVPGCELFFKSNKPHYRLPTGFVWNDTVTAA